MINTVNVKLNKLQIGLDNTKIEANLAKLGYTSIVRWAIVEIVKDEVIISVSYIAD